MSTSLSLISSDTKSVAANHSKKHQDYVTMRLDNQVFGIPVLFVQDVLRGQRIARIPLAPKEIAGSMNLRGRIVTVVDMRVRLGLPPKEYTPKTMSVVVEHEGEPYSLLVDSVGDVLSLPLSQFETTPANLSPVWRSISSGIYKLSEELLVIIDVGNLLKVSE
jgi:purine-binding chemotaxis protein CheW